MNPQLKHKIRECCARGASASIDLAYLLGPVYRDNLFLPEYPNFGAYWKGELKGFCGRTHAYDLAYVGIYFPGEHEPTVRAAVQDGRMGIADLIDLAKLVKDQKVTRQQALAHIAEGEPLPELDAPKETDSEDTILWRLEIPVKKGDVEHIKRGWIFEAIRGGHKSFTAAIAEFGINAEQNLTFPPWAESYRTEIEAGEFVCKLCGQIPTEPTRHHVIPQSIAQGQGPVVLLCWTPCHRDVVQRDWETWAVKWYGRATVDRWLQEFRSAA